MIHKQMYQIVLEPDRVIERLRTLFDIDHVHSITPMEGGYMCKNYRVQTQDGNFFLKQYRNQISSVVHEIKLAEFFFAEKGIPVIEPLLDRFERPVFWLDGHWLSLFPFIDKQTTSFPELTNSYAEALGHMLGRIHRMGRTAPYGHFQPLRLGDRMKFIIESIELQFELASRPEHSQLEQKIMDTLEKKRQWVESSNLPPKEIDLPFDCLLHGDFIYPNVFFDAEGHVTHIYDFEKTCNGPRAYEFARSLIINCFDPGWSPENFKQGKLFLEAYRDVQPLSDDDVAKGILMYSHDLMHSTWIEAKYVIYQVETQMVLYERHARRIEWMARDVDLFISKLLA
ncbi:MAG: phosphotransferase [Candidatus Uhrbacteria bacterium]|nr:phosphotransferase [Candidatus Uhrbacteria bacterium]